MNAIHLLIALFFSISSYAQNQSTITQDRIEKSTAAQNAIVGLEIGTGTLMLSGPKTNGLKNFGEYEQNALAGISVELPIAAQSSFITGLRYERLSWGMNTDTANTRLDNEYLSVPAGFRAYFNSNRIRPYGEAGIFLSQLISSQIKGNLGEIRSSDDFNKFNVRGHLAAGASVAITKSAQFSVALDSLMSLNDEIKGAQGTQRVSGISGLSQVTMSF